MGRGNEYKKDGTSEVELMLHVDWQGATCRIPSLIAMAITSRGGTRVELVVRRLRDS